MARDIVVIGGSAGALEVLTTISRGLPADLPATLFVVMHTAPQAESLLPELLSRRSALPAVHAVDGEAIVPGRIYIAPPDHHLLVYPHHVRVTRGAKENRHRPAVDPLFRTAARAYGRRVIGVVVSGSLDDGTAGLGAVKQAGGLAFVQEPGEATAPGMPTSAVRHVPVDRVLRAHEIAPALVDAIHEVQPEVSALVPAPDQAGPEAGEPSGERAVYSCPECGGVLMETREGGVQRFRCNVGHALSEQSLLDGQQGTLEYALWEALRALDERAALLRRLGSRTRAGSAATGDHFDRQAADAERRAELVRQALADLSQPPQRAQG